MKQMLVHCASDLTTMALIEDNRIIEYAVEYSGRQGGVGSFFKGKVVNVVPGMQAAFVDIGQKKNAFLYIDDVLAHNLDSTPKEKPSIHEVVKPGQELIVQVTKDAFGYKGARITTHYSLPGRWLVYMPNAGYVAISKKIKQDDERERLKAIGEELRNEDEGLILRTVAEHQSVEAIKHDFKFLQ
ncbi:Ribonuclease G [compost metagenome]